GRMTNGNPTGHGPRVKSGSAGLGVPGASALDAVEPDPDVRLARDGLLHVDRARWTGAARSRPDEGGLIASRPPLQRLPEFLGSPDLAGRDARLHRPPP